MAMRNDNKNKIYMLCAIAGASVVLLVVILAFLAVSRRGDNLSGDGEVYEAVGENVGTDENAQGSPDVMTEAISVDDPGAVEPDNGNVVVSGDGKLVPEAVTGEVSKAQGEEQPEEGKDAASDTATDEVSEGATAEAPAPTAVETSGAAQESVAAAPEAPADPAAGLGYKDGYKMRAQQFQSDCAVIYPGSKDDLSRFSVFDIDADGMPELIMHDVAGKRAYYCSFASGAVTEPFAFYEDVSDTNIYKPAAYAAFYPGRNLFIRYAISDKRKVIESYFYQLNAVTKAPELINAVSVEKKDGSLLFKDGSGNPVFEDDYRGAFRQVLGDDYLRYFLDDLMIADGEYDFRSEYTFNSKGAIWHMTLEEVLDYIDAM